MASKITKGLLVLAIVCLLGSVIQARPQDDGPGLDSGDDAGRAANVSSIFLTILLVIFFKRQSIHLLNAISAQYRIFCLPMQLIAIFSIDRKCLCTGFLLELKQSF